MSAQQTSAPSLTPGVVGASVPPAATAAAARATSAARRARLRACTILLVDDEPANLDLLEALLESEGYTQLVRTADPREVPALALRHAPDLVLLDLHMPHRHGLDVLLDLERATPPGDYRPVLVLTADATWEARERALALGARDFVTKPFDATEVLLRVENLLDTRVLHHEERQARERAEAAEARSALVAEWSGLLAASLEPATALAHLPRLLVPRWASACVALLRTGRAAPLAPAAEGFADARSATWAAALRERGAVLCGDGAGRAGDGHGSRAAGAAAPPRSEAAIVASPIVTGDGAVGALVLAGGAADQALVDELAARAGLAAEHARLLAAAELATRERERLLAVVAHDLRNPLGAVAMYAEMLASLQPDAPAEPPGSAAGGAGTAGATDASGRAAAYGRRALATIHASTVGMQRLVEDLLDVSSLREGALRIHRAEQPVRAPFEAAERMLRPLAEAAGVALAVEAQGEGATGTGALDAARVVQLLSNLVGNAVKFTPAGGAVRVRYGVADGALVGSVADTGPGIAEDELPHLFTAFWRGDRPGAREGGRGAGLGLWIARAIVEAHGGVLRVEPGAGTGAVFHFTLPLVQPERRLED